MVANRSTTKNVRTILDVHIRETVTDRNYEGSLDWPGKPPRKVKFSLNFKMSPFAPAAYTPGNYELTFSGPDEHPLPVALTTDLADQLFIPLSMAVSLLIDRRIKARGSEADLEIPVIAAEEQSQFMGYPDIFSYVMRLNP